MQKEKAACWINNNLNKLKKEFCLETWEISVYYRKQTPEKRFLKNKPSWFKESHKEQVLLAECETALVYESASFTIYYNNIANIKHLKETIRHEFYHIVCAGYLEWKNLLLKGFKKKEYEMLLDYLAFADEMTVRQLEKIEKRRTQKTR